MAINLAEISRAVVLGVTSAAVIYGAVLILDRVERWIEEDVMPVVRQKLDAWAERRL